MVLRGYCAGTLGTMRPRRNAFSSNELLHIEASFVPVQWTLPSDQGHRNKLPISMGDTQPFALQPLCSDMRIETCACSTAGDYIAARALIAVRWGPVAAS
jgi:hypothetical protein